MLNLKGKSFLKLLDFTPAEIEGLLDLSAELKHQKKVGIPHRLFVGKSIALILAGVAVIVIAIILVASQL